MDKTRKITYEYCSLKYLNIWLQNEKSFLELLHSEDTDKRIKAITEIAGEFRIGRSFATFKERKEDVLKLLDGIEKPKTVEQALEDVIHFSKELSKLFTGRGFHSPSSKFLWSKFQAPFVLFDKRSKNALNFKRNDYRKFYYLWRKNFKDHEEAITAACAKLPELQAYTWDANLKKSEIEAVCHTKWFSERVFDIYLWEQGG